MNTETNSFLCPACRNALTAGVSKCSCGYQMIESPPTDVVEIDGPNSDELLFAPADSIEEFDVLWDDELIAVDETTSMEAPILLASDPEIHSDFENTLVRSRPSDNAPSLETFVDVRPVTESFQFGVSENVRTPLRFVRTAALVAFAAVAGGFAVYIYGPAAEPIAIEKRFVDGRGETDLLSTDVFVSRVPTNGAIDAQSPIAPLKESSAGERIKPRADVASGSQPETIRDEVAADLPAAPDNQNAAPPIPVQEKKEAKVAGMVVEKPAGRKPLARCADGTYSYSASREAACSQRGGVSEWIADGKPAEKPAPRNTAYILGPRGGCYYLDSANKKVYVEKKYCN